MGVCWQLTFPEREGSVFCRQVSKPNNDLASYHTAHIFCDLGYDTEVTFRRELDLARSTLQGNGNSPAPPSAQISNAQMGNPTGSHALNIGAGFLGWKLDDPSGETAALLPIALEARVKAVWLSFGNDLGKWVRYVRSYDEQRRNQDQDIGNGSSLHKTVVCVLVNTLEEAKTALERWDVDVLVAQGALLSALRISVIFATLVFLNPLRNSVVHRCAVFPLC